MEARSDRVSRVKCARATVGCEEGAAKTGASSKAKEATGT